MTELNFLGGTDAAALAGVNPGRWAQPIDVYLEHVGLAPERQGTGMMGMGHLLEPIVASLFTEATGLALRRPAARQGRACRLCTRQGHPCTAVVSKRYPWMGGHLDRWAEDGLPFEAKWSMSSSEWGPGLGVGTPESPVLIPAPGDEGYQPRVPARYLVQVQHYLAVTERPTAYLAVLLGYGDFRWYAIHRNEAMIGTLVQLEERFWHDNVLAGVPPEPDGSESYGRRIRQLSAADDGSEAVATPEQQAMLEQLRAARQVLAQAAKAEAAVAQRLQLSMGGHARLVAPGATVSYKKGNDSLHVEWEALATALLGMARVPTEWLPESLPEGVPWDKLTKKARAEAVRAVARRLELAETKPGTRPFRVEYDSDEEG